MRAWFLTLLFAALGDAGAVVYMRSVRDGRWLPGLMATLALTVLQYGSIILVVSDTALIIPALVGHGGGFLGTMAFTGRKPATDA